MMICVLAGATHADVTHLAVRVGDADELHDDILVCKVLVVHVAAAQAGHQHAQLLVLLHLRPHAGHLLGHVRHPQRLSGCWCEGGGAPALRAGQGWERCWDWRRVPQHTPAAGAAAVGWPLGCQASRPVLRHAGSATHSVCKPAANCAAPPRLELTKVSDNTGSAVDIAGIARSRQFLHEDGACPPLADVLPHVCKYPRYFYDAESHSMLVSGASRCIWVCAG